MPLQIKSQKIITLLVPTGLQLQTATLFCISFAQPFPTFSNDRLLFDSILIPTNPSLIAYSDSSLRITIVDLVSEGFGILTIVSWNWIAGWMWKHGFDAIAETRCSNRWTSLRLPPMVQDRHAKYTLSPKLQNMSKYSIM